MKYYSTNGKAPIADLQKAVVKGLAEDRGLYMPEEIYKLPQAFINDMPTMAFRDIAYNVAQNFFGDDVDGDALQDIVYDTLSFDCPVVKVTENIYALELFHGPTLAFKDVGARFMARLLRYFLNKDSKDSKDVNVLVATSGDTGSAVANGFLGVDGIHVYVLYPKGKERAGQEGDGYTPTIDVKVSMSQPDAGEAELLIAITDNGMGMTPEVREKVFDTFFTTKPAGQGTGLGMSITYDVITKNHNGQLLLDTEPNVGTTFTFILPVKIVK